MKKQLSIKNKVEYKSYYYISISIIFIDKFHFEKNYYSLNISFCRKIQEILSKQPIFFFFILGTLLNYGPTNLKYQVHLINYNNQSNYPILKNWRFNKLKIFAKLWEKKLKNGIVKHDISQKIQNKIHPLIKTLIIKFDKNFYKAKTKRPQF